MSSEKDPNVINADPTKEFFITMLVKDIRLLRSILDLVDNSIDGAKRLRPDGDYTGLEIHLDVNSTTFIISDNCGGIPIEMAREYAFRFGRPKEMEKTKHSVGQFGVGMKRALFKLGNKFKIESISANSRFIVEIDVDEWKEQSEWKFEFLEYEEDLPTIPPANRGTTITVSILHESVSDDFELSNTETRIYNDLVDAYTDNVDQGLMITLNRIPVDAKPIKFLYSEDLKTAFRELDLIIEPDMPHVKVKIYAGISVPDPLSAGWYIFCNGRLVIGADQTLTTGWGEGEETTIPKYHNTHAGFRGVVYFDSEDASLLPWNTTKTGVDSDAKIYRRIRHEMINIMRPIIDFDYKLAAEKREEFADEKSLKVALNKAKLGSIINLPTNKTFIAPKPKLIHRPPSTGSIQYYKPIEKINKVKKVLKVKTYKSVGERTFDYFFEMECDD